MQTAGAESSALKTLGYFRGGWSPEWTTVALGLLVIAVMLLWPRSLARYVPGSLIGIVLATLLAVVTGWPAANIGAIPRTILLDDRLTLDAIPWDRLGDLLAPAVSIAALGAVESLLCGAVASKMTGIRLQADQSWWRRDGSVHHPLLWRRALHGSHRPHVSRHQIGRADAAGINYSLAGAAGLGPALCAGDLA